MEQIFTAASMLADAVDSPQKVPAARRRLYILSAVTLLIAALFYFLGKSFIVDETTRQGLAASFVGAAALLAVLGFFLDKFLGYKSR